MDVDRSGVMVVGAGIAGVACAGELVRAGIPVEIRERARVAGGRLASKPFDGRPADIGASYLTVSDPDFAAVVELVAHTTAEFASGHLPQPTAAGPAIEQAVRDLLGLPEPAEHVHVHRWTYAKPASGADGTYHLDADGIGLAGDAFGEPRVQSAWRSGRDLGRALVDRLLAVRG